MFRDMPLKHVAEDVLKLAKVCVSAFSLYCIRYLLKLFFVGQDGLERRGYNETGFLNALAEVVETGNVLFPGQLKIC